MQRGIKLPGSKEKAGKTFLLQKMNELESLKAAVSTREEVAEETVGQAHVETGAIKLFSWADDQDRNCNFGKAVIKAFYTASSIFETLRQFGDLSLEVEEKMKYAKVKAVYLSTCLKTGETPVPGNPAEDPVPLPPVPPAQDPTPTSVGEFPSQPSLPFCPSCLLLIPSSLPRSRPRRHLGGELTGDSDRLHLGGAHPHGPAGALGGAREVRRVRAAVPGREHGRHLPAAGAVHPDFWTRHSELRLALL